MILFSIIDRDMPIM